MLVLVCLLLEIFNFLFDNSLCIFEGLSRQIEQHVGIVVLIHVFKNLLANLERLLLLDLGVLLVVFVYNTRLHIFARATLHLLDVLDHLLIKEIDCNASDEFMRVITM